MLTFTGEITIFLALVTAFSLVALLTPSVVKIAQIKDLVAVPNGRTSHNGLIPSLGGFSIFTSILIVSLFFLDFTNCYYCKIFLIGALITFSIGLKDDILIIDPYKKLIGQIISALLIIYFADLRFTNLHGFLGIHEINYFASLMITTFVIIVITNSFNLIDGIDGLASGIGIIASAAFGYWFYIIGEIELAILAATIIGAYSGFLMFNVSSGKNKIFMGDGGSLLLGFTMAFLAIKLNQVNLYLPEPQHVSASPAVTFGVLIVPLFDTLRVFTLRIIRKRSPFSADKLHVHHRLLEITGSHIKSTLIILIVNLFFIWVSFNLQNLGIVLLMIINLSLAAILSYIPVLMLQPPKIRREKLRPIYYFLKVVITIFR